MDLNGSPTKKKGRTSHRSVNFRRSTLNFQHLARSRTTAISLCVSPGPRRREAVVNRDPRFALSQELEAKQTLLNQLRDLAAEDPEFLTNLLEGETNLLELIAALDASIVDDEILV